MSKGSNRRNEDTQKVRDNWDAIKWESLPEKRGEHPACSFPFCECKEKCKEVERVPD